MGSKPKAPSESAEEREFAAIAAESSDDWKQRWLPLQREFFEEVQDIEPERQLAMGSANVDYRQAFGQAQQGLESRMMAGGVAPGSGRFAMGLGGFANDRAQAMGQGMADVDALIDDQYAAGLQSLIDIGRGERASALQGLSNAADAAQQQSFNDSRIALGNRSANMDAFGTAAGMATAYGLKGYQNMKSQQQFKSPGSTQAYGMNGAFGAQMPDDPIADAFAGVSYKGF